jgi:hypothetical protein
LDSWRVALAAHRFWAVKDLKKKELRGSFARIGSIECIVLIIKEIGG